MNTIQSNNPLPVSAIIDNSLPATCSSIGALLAKGLLASLIKVVNLWFDFPEIDHVVGCTFRAKVRLDVGTPSACFFTRVLQHLASAFSMLHLPIYLLM